MPENLFKPRAALSRRERKYCTCLLKARNKSTEYNPYAVCTRSVYNLQGVKRRKTVDCDYNYNYEKVPIEMLRSLAKERGVPVHGVKGNNKVLTPKKTLINRLSRKITERRTKRYKSYKEKAKMSNKK